MQSKKGLENPDFPLEEHQSPSHIVMVKQLHKGHVKNWHSQLTA
jgi:hypothetical protein